MLVRGGRVGTPLRLVLVDQLYGLDEHRDPSPSASCKKTSPAGSRAGSGA